MAAATAELGVPYSWGGGDASGPSLGIASGAKTTGFDCSGLVLYAVAQASRRRDRAAALLGAPGDHGNGGCAS